MARSLTFRDDGPDPIEGEPICYALHRQHRSGFWREPRSWAVSPMVAETAKTWVRLVGRNNKRRSDLDLIVARFSTRAEADAARLRAIDVFDDVAARKAAVDAEMREAMRPFQDRLIQLNAEYADRLRDETA